MCIAPAVQGDEAGLDLKKNQKSTIQVSGPFTTDRLIFLTL